MPEFPETQPIATRRALLKQAARGYLNEREAADAAAKARKTTNDRLDRSKAWLEKYRASGKAKTSFNWGTISSPINRSTTNVEKAKAGAEVPEAQEAPAVSHGESLGDATRQDAVNASRGADWRQDAAAKQGVAVGNPAAQADAGQPDPGQQWQREEDTPF